MAPELDPRAEAAFLTAALQRQIRRRDKLGQRSSAAPEDLPELPINTISRGPLGDSKPATSKPDRAPAAAMPPPPAGDLGREEVQARAAAVRALAQATSDLDELEAQVASCTACGLCAKRTRTVFADGEGTRSLLFLGEAPGEQEDRSGTPFVGPAGQLLTDIIEKGMGIRRAEVSVANILKCRPPGNRDPSPAEKAICTGWLERQIELLDPRVIVPLGRHASQFMLGGEDSMGRMRAAVHERKNRKIVPTYHPSYLLRTPGAKRDCWADIQLAMAELGIQRPQK